jgi:phytoene/squalene synthetase
VVHSFAITARTAGIGNEIIEPFFKSMRMDISKKKFNKKDFDEYVYGSAEVVGLMCLKVFISGIPQTEKERLTLVRGARALGAAFQKVNFLRDLKADEIGLGRTYFPGIALDKLSDLEKNKLCDDIDNDLEIAAATIPMLPSDSARAVKLAYSLFQGLNNRIRNQPIQKIKENRIRVPNFEKLLILFRVMVGLKNG